MRNYFPKRPSGAPLHALSKLYAVHVGFVTPPYFEAEYCLFCGRRRVAVARYRMICLVLVKFGLVVEEKKSFIPKAIICRAAIFDFRSAQLANVVENIFLLLPVNFYGIPFSGYNKLKAKDH